MRLLELQTEADSRQACAAAGREVPDANLRGWAALIPEGVLAEGLRQSGLAVLQGTRGALALGSIAQIWLAARSLATRSSASLAGSGARADAPSGLRRVAGRRERVEAPAQLAAGGRTLVMGIVNATPDSFSDGGAYDPVARGSSWRRRERTSWTWGESTRPDAEPVDTKEERRRTEGVVGELPDGPGCRSASIPPRPRWRPLRLMRGEIVNDVSGGVRIRRCSAPQARAFCLMHMRGTPQEMQSRAVYSTCTPRWNGS